MNNMYGITGIKVKIIEVNGKETKELDDFLTEYDGNIITIQTIGMMYGVCKFIVTYKTIED